MKIGPPKQVREQERGAGRTPVPLKWRTRFRRPARSSISFVAVLATA